MRVDTVKQAAFGRTGTRPDDATPAQAEHGSESRALVALAPASAPPPPPANYREASFLAHLIATKDRAPQTRERRRAEPSEAIAAYRAAAALIGSN